MTEESLSQDNTTLDAPKRSLKTKITLLILLVPVALSLFYFFILSEPSGFVPGTVLEIEPGMSLHSISARLKNEHIIRSRVAFEGFVIFFGGEKHIKFSNYVFDVNMPVYDVAQSIIKGNRFMAPIIVTIPEGYNLKEIADTYQTKLKSFNRDTFLSQAKEGYLFPDTYYFFNSDTELNVIDSMSKNFEKKFAPVRAEMQAAGKKELDVLTMASILEKEAKGETDRAIISGILWKRLSIGMLLQVDAAPMTYKIKGLPKNPIGNPGLDAIHDAIYPESSPYLYYLHGKDGNTYYAKNFAEHKKNIARYLR